MIKDTFYTLFTRYLIFFGKIIYSMVVSRTLGPEYKGVFELIQLAPDTLSHAGTMGFDEANTYLTGKDKKNVSRLISNSFGLMLRVSLIAIAIGVVYMKWGLKAEIYNYIPQWAGFIALLVIPIAILDMLLESILYGGNRIWVRNWHEIIRLLSALIFIGAFVVIFHMKAKGAILGYILVNVSLFTFTIIVLLKNYRITFRKFNIPLVKKGWNFGRFMFGANLASYLFYKIDLWLLSLLYVPAINLSEYTQPGGLVLEQVGLYSLAVNIVTSIWHIPDAVKTALVPKITMKGESERRKLVPPSLRAVTVVVLIAMIVLALIARQVIDIMYNKPDAEWDWTRAYFPLMLLLPGIFAISLAKVFIADFFSRGKPYYIFWVSATSLILNLLLNLNFIPKWGMNGAAVASSISYTFSFLMFLYFYVKVSGERSRDIFIPKKDDFRTLWRWTVLWMHRKVAQVSSAFGKLSSKLKGDGGDPS